MAGGAGLTTSADPSLASNPAYAALLGGVDKDTAASNGVSPAMIGALGLGGAVASSGNAALAAATPPSKNADGTTTPSPTVGDSLASGASKAVKSLFETTGANIQSIGNSLQQAVEQGKQIGAAAVATGQQQQQQNIALGQTTGQINANEALAKARIDAATAANATRVGLLGPAFQDKLKSAAALGNEIQGYDAKLQKQKAVGFFDDPGSFLLNQFVRIPYNQYQKEAAVSRLGDLANSTAEQAQLLEAGRAGSAAINSANTTQQAALIAKASQQLAAIQGSESILKASQQDISALGLSVTASGATINANEALAGLPVKAATAEFYSANAQSSIALKQERTEGIKQRLIDMGHENDLINAGRLSFGLPPVSEGTKLPTVLRTGWANIGNSFAMNGGAIGPDPAKAVQNLTDAGIPASSLPAGQLQTIAAIQNRYIAAQADLRQKVPGIKEEDLETNARGTVRDQFAAERNHISDDGQQTLFNPEPLNGIVTRKWADNNPIIRSMYPMVVQNGQVVKATVPFRYQDAISAGNNLVDSGKLTQDQMNKFIIDIAHNTLADKDRAYGYRRFAIPGDSPDYNVMLPRPGGDFAQSEEYNLFNPAKIAQYSMLMKSAQRTKQMIQDSSFLNK